MEWLRQVEIIPASVPNTTPGVQEETLLRLHKLGLEAGMLRQIEAALAQHCAVAIEPVINVYVPSRHHHAASIAEMRHFFIVAPSNGIAESHQPQPRLELYLY